MSPRQRCHRSHRIRSRSRLLTSLVTRITALGASGVLLSLFALPPAMASGYADGDRRAVWPLDPRPTVVAGFDPPATRFGAGHRGVDLDAIPGQAVRASLPGRVSFAGRVAGRGVVVVDHGHSRTTYEPVSSAVAVGARVVAGEKLGELEPVAGHCWPASCLHWGLIVAEEYRDPLGLVGGGPIRLLPLEALRRPGPAGLHRQPHDPAGSLPAVVVGMGTTSSPPGAGGPARPV